MKTRCAAIVLAAALAAGLAGCGKAPESADSLSYRSADISFSEGLDDNGYLSGVSAADYVTLPEEFDRIPVEAGYADPSDAELDNAVKNLLYGYRREVQVTDRPVVKGDTVNLDFSAVTADGKKIDNADTRGEGAQVTAGSDQYVGGLLTQIIGHAPGDTFEVPVTYPDPYENQPDLAGKDAVFTVTINYITEYETPEFTDAFVKENLYADYGCSTVEEARALLADGYRREKLSSYFFDYLRSHSTSTSLPEAYVGILMRRSAQSDINSAVDSGETLSDFLKGKSADSLAALEESYRTSAESTTLDYLILQCVADRAGISVTAEDLKDYADLAERYGKGYVAHLQLQDKVQDYLLSHAVYG